MGFLPGKNSALFALTNSALFTHQGCVGHPSRRRRRDRTQTFDVRAQPDCLGVDAIIGTGIFVAIGECIGQDGPAVIVWFALAAITCLFSALSYSELAASTRCRAAQTAIRAATVRSVGCCWVACPSA